MQRSPINDGPYFCRVPDFEGRLATGVQLVAFVRIPICFGALVAQM